MSFLLIKKYLILDRNKNKIHIIKGNIKMVHSLEFSMNFQNQHNLGQQNIKRKFCSEEGTIKQVCFINNLIS